MKGRLNVTGVILAGGKSKRMGSDKGLMDFRGRKLVEHSLESLSKVTADVAIISSNPEYGQFGYTVWKDIHPDSGPMGGLHAALYNARPGYVLLLGCDMPFMNSGFLKFLTMKINDIKGNCIIPVHANRIEPLCAIYSSIIIEEVEKAILNGELKLTNLIEKLDCNFVEVPSEKFDVSSIFKNVNTIEDLSAANTIT